MEFTISHQIQALIQSIVQLDQDRINTVYSEFVQMRVPLDQDPIVYGPPRLISKISQIRSYLDRCCTVNLQLSDELARVRRVFRLLESEYKVKSRHLMVNDRDVQQGRNLRDRESMVEYKLAVYVEWMDKLSSMDVDYVHLLSQIDTCKVDLKDTQQRLKDQMSLCQDEIRLGRKWYSKLGSEFLEQQTEEPDNGVSMVSVMEDMASKMEATPSLSAGDKSNYDPFFSSTKTDDFLSGFSV